MTNSKLGPGELDIVVACRPADLAVLRLAIDGLSRFVFTRRFYIVTAGSNFDRFRRTLGDTVELLDEDAMIPGMTLADLRRLPLPGFPKGAGWYFQQLLKFAFCFNKTEDDYYLIWDADTIPLRSLEFFDSSGRMLLTTASEEHAPYFDTYRRLLREEPNREFSFIAQHMVAQKSVIREMLARIESNFTGSDSWAWKIMRNLDGSSLNSFSEYETLGHFIKNHYPDRVAFRALSWLREGAFQTKGVPSRTDLEQLATQYDFIAFESSHMPLRRFVRRARAWFRGR